MKRNLVLTVSKVTNLTNLNAVIADNTAKKYCYKGIKFMILKSKNDTNGNPVYRISFKNNALLKQLKGKFGRTYLAKNFTSFQSYNLASDLQFIFKQIQ
jgi:hypothetical protein